MPKFDKFETKITPEERGRLLRLSRRIAKRRYRRRRATRKVASRTTCSCGAVLVRCVAFG